MKPTIPKDYAEGRIPRAERREEGSVAMCIGVFSVAAGIFGAIVMWLYMTLGGGC